MRILIIGGTRFVGRHLAETASTRGHEVTLFNRGISDPGAFPHLDRVAGDREHDLHLLEGRAFDAVIDTCGYVPRVVKASAEALSSSGKYVFISSVSAFGTVRHPGVDETGEVATLRDPTVEEVTGDTYGGLKALCEMVVQEVFGERAINIRPGLIVGPWDPTDRFTYWPVRVERGGRMVAPGSPNQQIQFIDARDLAEWTLNLVEQGAQGLYTAVGPEGRFTMGELIDGCLRMIQQPADVVWVPDEVLLSAGVAPWQELPLWIPESSEMSGMQKLDNSKAVRSGIQFRSVDETVRDTLDWFHLHRKDSELKAGLDPVKEQVILEVSGG